MSLPYIQLLNVSVIGSDAYATLQASTLTSSSPSTAQSSTPNSSAKVKSWAAVPPGSGKKEEGVRSVRAAKGFSIANCYRWIYGKARTRTRAWTRTRIRIRTTSLVERRSFGHGVHACWMDLYLSLSLCMENLFGAEVAISTLPYLTLPYLTLPYHILT